MESTASERSNARRLRSKTGAPPSGANSLSTPFIRRLSPAANTMAAVEGRFAALIAQLGLANIMQPADVCKTRATVTSKSLFMWWTPDSTTTIVPSSR